MVQPNYLNNKILLRKYASTLNIFIVFEKLPFIFWTSKESQPNAIWLNIPANWLYALNIFLKNEIFYSQSFIAENSALDNKQNFFLNKQIKQTTQKTQLLIFYQYYIYNLKIKLTLLIFNSSLIKINSLDGIYKSLNWLERETSEMFKIKFNNKTDIRRLLLDYTKNENPLLKDYPSEGYNDVYYCFFNDQVIFEKNDTTEL